MNKEGLKELERQLGCPEGEQGKKIGVLMNKTNFSMTMNAINTLKIKSKDHILELGHGNGGHLSLLLERAENISYYGLEISKIMNAEAVAKTTDLKKDSKVSFSLYDGENLPYTPNSMDKIFSVNTIYFWKNPKTLLKEMCRVLKKEGLCVICYVQKDFMQKLPFVNERFNLFSKNDFINLVQETDFMISEVKDTMESVTSKSGDLVDRTYTTAILIKK